MASMVPLASQDVLILLPVFNDWASLSALLRDLDATLADAGLSARILAVDDGSLEQPADDLGNPALFQAIRRVDVLSLRRNLGHQRAIAIGLAHVEGNDPCDMVVVMDSDGEDNPRDVPRLLARCCEEGCNKIVFAERTKRSESRLFKLGYHSYRFAHLLLTGHRVRVGNFSVIPRARLTSLVVVWELWNHYAAAVLKSRQPFCTIPTQRATRYFGRSHMNYVALVAHGLSAISVFSDLVGVRLLVVSLLLIFITLAGMATTVYLRTMTNLAIVGWATTAFGILAVVFLQGVMFAAVFSVMVLGGRSSSYFLPLRDYGYFVHSITPLCEASWASTHTSAPSSTSSRPR